MDGSGITHISLGVLVILASAIEGAGDPTTSLVYVVSAALLASTGIVQRAVTRGDGPQRRIGKPSTGGCPVVRRT